MASIQVSAEVRVNPKLLESLLLYAFNQGFDARHQYYGAQIDDSSKHEIMKKEWLTSDTVRDFTANTTSLNSSITVIKVWR